jgi:tRNA nucleotidyltransferase/poly(A) polymerase
MGVFNLFSREGRQSRARERNISRAVNKYAQSPDRLKALQALRDDGSLEALYGLFRRFGMMYDKTIEDEQEKDWVFEVLVEKGASILPALKKYLFGAESISWPLRVLDRVANKEQELEVLTEVLARHEPGYERDPTKKIQLLNHLAGFKDPRVPPLLVPYLGDMDEGVRYAAVEALVRQGDEAVAREPLLELFTSAAEESLRIRIQIADGFTDLGWLIKGYREAVESRLPEPFQLDREGHIKKKPQAKD